MTTLFHVGYQKCASSFLQMALFEAHPEIWHTDAEPLVKGIVETPYLDYDAPAAAEAFAAERATADAKGRSVLVISNENIVTRPGLDSGMLASRLHRLDPAGKVLIVIRNQIEYFASTHTQSLATGKTKVPVLADWLYEISASKSYNNFFEKADFAKQIGFFDQLFGPEKVGVFLLEDMVCERAKFAESLGSFIGIDMAPVAQVLDPNYIHQKSGKTARMARSSRWSILQRTNPVVATLDRTIRPLVPASARRAIGSLTGLSRGHNTEVDIETKAQLSALFRQGNNRLAKRLNRDLASLGYPV